MVPRKASMAAGIRARMLSIALLLLMAASASFGAATLHRSAIEYNSEGRYFDERSGVILHEQSLVFFGAGFAVSILLAAVVAWKLWISRGR